MKTIIKENKFSILFTLLLLLFLAYTSTKNELYTQKKALEMAKLQLQTTALNSKKWTAIHNTEYQAQRLSYNQLLSKQPYKWMASREGLKKEGLSHELLDLNRVGEKGTK